MSTASIDSLIWIKTELERTLEAARRCLDAYAEEPDNHALFDEFIQHMHQATGTFGMLEVRGGRMLGEHVESLAHALREGRQKGDTDAYELLMRANLELSDYLDRMVSGMRDTPAVLLSTTNEIRARLGDEPLQRERLTQRARAPMPEKPSGEDVVTLVARLRPQYQAALLDFFHDRQRAEAIAKMADVVATLEVAATTPAVFETLWVAGGVFEALGEGGLVPSLAVNRVLGQFERELKRLATSSEAAIADAPPESLVSRMLSELEEANFYGERVRAILDTFRLGEDDSNIDEAHVATGPGSALLNSAGAAVLEDLARVRDRIDIFVRTGSRNPGDLAPLVDTLKKVGDALGMLGLDTAQQHVAHERDAIRRLADEEEADASALLTLATGLISVESDVEAYLAGAGNNPESLAGRNARFAGLREALAEISRIKDGFGEYVRDSDPGQLQSLPQMLARLSRTLDFLSLEAAAAPIRRIGAYIDRVRSGTTLPERIDLDRLADAVVSVEYYLETLQHGREASASMLDNADRALQALNVAENAAPEEPVKEDSASFEADEAQTEEGPATMQAEAPEQAVAEEASVEPRREEIGPMPPESSVATSATPPAAPDMPQWPPVREAGADPEIIAVFLDEAREVRETLDAHLPPWQADPDDREALAVIRRSFHTLKGSGRMVGAQRLGEFAWAYENLLNRVIDYTLAPEETIVAAVAEAIGATGELLAQFDTGAEPQIDVYELFTRAWILVRGEGLPDARIETAPGEEGSEEREESFGEASEQAAPSEAAEEAFAEAADQAETAPSETLEEPSLEAEEQSGGEEDTSGEGARPRARDAESEPDEKPPAIEAGFEPSAVDEAVESSPTAEPVAAPIPTPRLEPVLHGIYRRETQEHLAIVQAWLEEQSVQEEVVIGTELLRAIHTLEGSASMAGVDEMTALFAPLDATLGRLGEGGIDPSGELPASLAEARSMAHALLAAYSDATRELPDWEPVVERMVEYERAVRLAEEASREAAAEESKAEETNFAPEKEPGTMETAAPEVEDRADEVDEVLEATEEAPSETVSAQAPVGEPIEEELGNVVDLAEEEGYDPELAQIFIPEANELLDASDAAAYAWSQNHDLVEPLNELLRRMHTLKGGARMAGVTPLADLTHELESVLTRVSDGRIVVSDDLLRLVERTLDRLHRMVVRLSGDGKIQIDVAIVAELHEQAGLRAPIDSDEPLETEEPETSASEIGKPAEVAEPPEVVEEEEAEAEAEEEASEDEARAEETSQQPAQAAGTTTPERARTVRHEMARVRADLLETSINNTGEVSIYRGRIEEQLRSMQVHVTELDRTVDRLRDQLRELEMETEAQILSSYEQRPDASEMEFDPLEFDRYTRIHELSRSLAEAISDLTSLRSLFTTDLSQANLLLDRQGRVNAELQDALMRTRMVPFSLSAPRLRRLVRQVSQDTGKQVEFTITGGEGEMDRQLVGHILPALEHLLRNAVVHGIEEPGVRTTRGKPGSGNLALALKRDGGDMLIEVSDDGAGLDLGAIREKATAEGLINAETQLSEAQIIELVFRSGFSTSESVTQAAGRGVGMDVVAAEARQVGGSTEIETKARKGTTCRIRLPATLAITQTLLVRIGQTLYPVALASITGIARLARSELQELLEAETPSFEYDGEPYELVSLAAVLDEEPPPADELASRQPLLLVNTGGRRVALMAEDMESSREIVVKPVGPQVAGIPGIAGATIFGDGSIGLLLDLTSLVRGLPQAAQLGEAMEQAAVEAKPTHHAAPLEPLVMVVDDSITVRRVTQRLLERNGVRVLTAKDGVEALDLLQDNHPDTMLLDIEMPRMDGYELAGHMKNNAQLRDIPIIVITSRTGDKHRERARQIGIEHYLGKPYQDTDLIAAVQKMVPRMNVATEAGQES
jgi:chemosensory pili system protein ChpA (sensor histidine kinase/response regulator)